MQERHGRWYRLLIWTHADDASTEGFKAVCGDFVNKTHNAAALRKQIAVQQLIDGRIQQHFQELGASGTEGFLAASLRTRFQGNDSVEFKLLSR
jgi:hypothetical protein